MSTDQSLYLYDEENVSLMRDHESSDDETEQKEQCENKSSDISKHNNARRKLICAAILSIVFMIVELTGGYFAGSLAIMSDAAHLITDSLTFVIGVFGITWAQKEPNSRMNFGYKRVEVFCAIISIFGIWVLTLFILYFAVQRLSNLDGFEINTDTMLGVSILGILVNLVMAAILHGGSCNSLHHNHSHGTDLLKHHQLKSIDEEKNLQITAVTECKSAENINVQAAYLHVLGDFIQSIGVIVAAIIIKVYPQAKIVDPLITFLFSVIVVCTTLKIFKKSSMVLLEAAPSHISYDSILKDLENIDGVGSVRDLKMWSLSNDLHFLNAHILVKEENNCQKVLKEALKISKMHGVDRATIQMEIKGS